MGFFSDLFGGSNSSSSNNSYSNDGKNFAKVSENSSSGNKVDVYLGDPNTGNHCHYFVSENGQSGMVHRGECDDCSPSPSTKK